MANSTVSSEKEAAQWDLERPIRFLIWHQGCREDRVASSVPPCTLLLVPFSAEGLWSASGVRIPLCPPSAVILALGFSRKAFSNCLNDPTLVVRRGNSQQIQDPCLLCWNRPMKSICCQQLFLSTLIQELIHHSSPLSWGCKLCPRGRKNV